LLPFLQNNAEAAKVLATDEETFQRQVRQRINEFLGKEDHLRALLILEGTLHLSSLLSFSILSFRPPPFLPHIGIAKHVPEEIDHFMVKIVAWLKRYVGEIQVIALQLIKLRAAEV